MNPRIAPTITSVFLLICSTTTAFASPRIAGSNAGSSTPQSGPMRTVSSYFAALNHHDFRALDLLYAPGVTMTESLTGGQPRIHYGAWKIRAFDGQDWLSWFGVRSKQLSPSTVLTIERASAAGPGHELARAEPWLTLFTIKNGKIISLVWMPC